MRALVTGAAGFVGSTLVKRLIQDGHDVIGIDAMTDYYEVSIKRANISSIGLDRFSFVEGDLNKLDLVSLLQGVDWIFHQAGQPGVRKSWGEDFAIYTRANVDATQRLLEAVRQIDTVKRFVYASSSSVYGDAERYPTQETDRPQPMSPYGVTKLSAEHLCCLYAENFGVPTVSLRYFTVYGPGQRTDMAFTRFTKAAVLDEKIQIYGNGEQIRDFTYVDDVVDANVRAAQIDSPAGSVFNVAGGSNTSVNEVLDLLGELSETSLSVDYGEKIAGDVYRTGGNTDQIRNALGWSAQVGLREGLEQQLNWARTTFGG
ncbi:GDP-mannose 4,6-dehydratase [Kocuria flava]|uniref:NAD-dependent epimerase/dehydratase family protein n=1 Tax=Kocuria flava TaxID=446860 RepID=UPI001FF50104|nr:NAD-dependent epimerase/dehydratase family protein [Kocuria flava]MCJ8504808.1 GDP-mannose 4,6-dehydratase [Kocuria flava]